MGHGPSAVLPEGTDDEDMNDGRIGLTADIWPKRTNRRRPWPTKLVVTIVALVSVLGAFALPMRTLSSEPGSAELVWTERITNGTSTIWLFHGWLSPEYDFTFALEVRGCSGPNGTITYQEHEGNHLGEFYYHGQDSIYLGSGHITTYNRTGSVTGEAWYWLGNLTRDYRAGNWTPEDGISFSCSDGQVFTNATLVVLGDLVIPEFSLIVAIVILMTSDDID